MWNTNLTHDFFNNFADAHVLWFKSIRPGTKAHDPTITQLRVMIYLPSGKIMYKIDFNDEYRDLPRKIIPYNCAVNEIKIWSSPTTESGHSRNVS